MQRSQNELNQIALGIHNGHIFTDRHIREHDYVSVLPMIFLPMALLDKEGLEALRAKKPELFFEELSKAGPRAINGYPTFFSMQYLDREEFDVVSRKLEEIKQAMRSVMAHNPTPEVLDGSVG